METTKLTIRLPADDVAFAKRYAREHGLTVTALVNRYFRRLQLESGEPIHPEVLAIRGILPDADLRAEHRDHLDKKHR